MAKRNIWMDDLQDTSHYFRTTLFPGVRYISGGAKATRDPSGVTTKALAPETCFTFGITQKRFFIGKRSTKTFGKTSTFAGLFGKEK